MGWGLGLGFGLGVRINVRLGLGSGEVALVEASAHLGVGAPSELRVYGGGELLREYVEEVLPLLLRCVGVGRKWAFARAKGARCAAWWGGVGGQVEVEGYRREGYRRVHVGLREQVALLHGVDPEDEVILACATLSSMCSEAAVFAQCQRWGVAGALGR